MYIYKCIYIYIYIYIDRRAVEIWCGGFLIFVRLSFCEHELVSLDFARPSFVRLDLQDCPLQDCLCKTELSKTDLCKT